MARRSQPRRLSFGRTRQERSGRWSAAYLHEAALHRAPATFAAKSHAVAWLQSERDLIDLDSRNPGTWVAPADRAARAEAAKSVTTVGMFAETWLTNHPLTRRGRDSYRSHFELRLYGTALAATPITAVTTAEVRDWFGALDATKPTARARTYEAVSSMFSAAVEDGLLSSNPCKIRNASKVRRARPVTHVESPEVAALAAAMPDRLRAAVLLGAWAGLRYGETIALDRADIAPDGSSVTVSKGVIRRNGVTEIAAPKSGKSRVVAVPSNVRDALVRHLDAHVAPGRDAPLFADADGVRITEGKFRPHWHRARAAVGRTTLRFHDLRHFAGLTAALAGATLAESMSRLGHSSPKMALHYSEVAAGRDAQLADRIAALAVGT